METMKNAALMEYRNWVGAGRPCTNRAPDEFAAKPVESAFYAIATDEKHPMKKLARDIALTFCVKPQWTAHKTLDSLFAEFEAATAG